MTTHYYSAYNTDAEKFFEMYQSTSIYDVHIGQCEILKQGNLTVLDIGSGSGRDAHYMASRGNVVFAIEPAGNLLELAKKSNKHDKITWICDSLPDLTHVKCLNVEFDLIWLSAVWHHVNPDVRLKSLQNIVSLLSPDGKIMMLIRRGPTIDSRVVYQTDLDELRIIMDKQFSMRSLCEIENEDLLKRPNVSWISLLWGRF